MKFITLFLSLLLSTTSFASDGCKSMYPHGKPMVTTTEEITYLCRKMYVVEHSPSRHTAYWAAERLDGTTINVAATRVNAFRADPDLPKMEAADVADYVGTSYDKGHLAPVGNMHADTTAMLESFYLSNMVPQHPLNNRIGWKIIEGFVREIAMARGELFVFTGPIYKGKYATIGPTKVAIPTHLYKIVYDPKTNASLSFLTLNYPFYQKDIPSAISTISTIEKMSKIKFFPTAKEPIKESTQMWTAKSN